jgi:L-ascorbate metabolism protein UlaG (beta-lactamase superfamily)
MNEFIESYETDRFKTDIGPVDITYLGHGTLFIKTETLNIHIDPVSDYADYDLADDGDIILITHHHGDHLDQEVLRKISGENTRIFLTEEGYKLYPHGEVLHHGDVLTLEDITIEAVPAYNTSPGHEKFHPPRRDNGYILTLGGKKIYIAGDTEIIPEMEELEDIYIAFLPMNQPYTMLPEQVAKAARIIDPEILIPYHYGDTDTEELIRMLEDWEGEVRIRELQ